jgi:hypothetical protein
MNLRAAESLSNIDQFSKKNPESGVKLPEPTYGPHHGRTPARANALEGDGARASLDFGG